MSISSRDTISEISADHRAAFVVILDSVGNDVNAARAILEGEGMTDIIPLFDSFVVEINNALVAERTRRTRRENDL